MVHLRPRWAAAARRGNDHAEGMGLIGPQEEKTPLVVYYSPAAVRLSRDGAVVADVVCLPYGWDVWAAPGRLKVGQ